MLEYVCQHNHQIFISSSNPSVSSRSSVSIAFNLISRLSCCSFVISWKIVLVECWCRIITEKYLADKPNEFGSVLVTLQFFKWQIKSPMIVDIGKFKARSELLKRLEYLKNSSAICELTRLKTLPWEESSALIMVLQIDREWFGWWNWSIATCVGSCLVNDVNGSNSMPRHLSQYNFKAQAASYNNASGSVPLWYIIWRKCLVIARQPSARIASSKPMTTPQFKNDKWRPNDLRFFTLRNITKNKLLILFQYSIKFNAFEVSLHDVSLLIPSVIGLIILGKIRVTKDALEIIVLSMHHIIFVHI